MPACHHFTYADIPVVHVVAVFRDERVVSWGDVEERHTRTCAVRPGESYWDKGADMAGKKKDRYDSLVLGGTA